MEQTSLSSLSICRKLGLLITLMLLSLAFTGCGLKRSNPLDPIGNTGVVVPDAVMFPTATASPAHASVKSVTLRWTANDAENTSGYYIYRGLGYFSSYTLVGTVLSAGNNSFIHTGPTVLPGSFYFYRVSAFKSYPDGNLEGARTDVAPIMIPE